MTLLSGDRGVIASAVASAITFFGLLSNVE